MPSFIDLTGKTFGRWTVLHRASDRIPGHPRFQCRCSCGKEGVIAARMLREGLSRSCGCFARERHAETIVKVNFKHGRSGTPEHNTWMNIRQRCENSTSAAFHKYGAKGIRVCERWQSFDNFYADMGPRPSPHHSIDRIDYTGDYEPANCRWATLIEQANNKSSIHQLTLNGETLKLSDWAKRLGIRHATLLSRLSRGWSAERILTQPVRGR